MSAAVGFLGRGRLTAILLVLVVAAAVGVGLVVAGDRSDTAPGGQITSEAQRRDLEGTAGELAARTLSSNFATLDQDSASIGARMTAAYRREYERTLADIREKSIQQQIVITAEPVASAVISATATRAQVLVFVNRSSTIGAGKNGKVEQIRLIVSLVHGRTNDKDAWLISDLTALG